MRGIEGSLEGIPMVYPSLFGLHRLIPTIFLFFSLLKLAAFILWLNEGYREIGLNEGYRGVPAGLSTVSSSLIQLHGLVPTTIPFFYLLKLAASIIGLNEGYRAQFTL